MVEKQQVKCNGATSSWKLIKFGVPQGSILGPLLFLIYINDLPNVSSILHFVLFADDSNIFVSHKSYDELFRILNENIVLVSEWFRANKLSLNLTKTNYILFCSHRKTIPNLTSKVSIDNVNIPQVKEVKPLVVCVDQYLTWNRHIEHIALKLAKNIGIIKRISYLLPRSILLTLYYSMVYPYLSYCNMIWASNYNSRFKRIIVLQKRIVRIIACSPYSSHSEHLFTQLGILTVLQVKQLQMCEFMHRYTTCKL